MQVTVGADGYENMTINSVEGGHIVAYLRRLTHAQSSQEAETYYKLNGSVSDFNNLISDNNIDLALVMPSLLIEDLTSKPII
jgi:hypothetical protein